MTTRALLACALVALAMPARAQLAEWKKETIPEWLVLGAEYRVRTLYVDPFDLSGTEVQDAKWTEQRLRLDLGFKWPKVGGVTVQLDLVDGVLFGDNGDFGKDPKPVSGLAVTSRAPNSAGWDIGLISGRDPLNADSYAPALVPIEPIRVNHAYGDVYLPFGLLRVGRQPVTAGASISAHDGSRTNRWGVSTYSEVGDRVLFATKLDEAIKLLTEDDHVADASADNGVFLIFAWDWQVQDDIHATDDDLNQITAGLQWRVREADWLGVEWKELLVSALMVHKFADDFDTAIWAFPLRAKATIGPVALDLQYSIFTGGTREVSEGFAVLSSKPPGRQDVLAMGASAVIDVLLDPVTATLEFDFATGDADPRSRSALTTFTFARDTNVGLLLFDHILAFESARSAAVGIENLRQLNAPSFPLTEVSTEGRFTNAYALFPQVKVDALQGPHHWLHVRFGALFAWPEAGVVDPITTILAEDGDRIDDDAVNFHGGKPGSYYGTELDLQVQWTFRDLFTWTVEAAVLFPGDGLEDENGDAVTSFLVENRFLFVF
ncbi:MAG: hypothetical protein AMXMBFR64_47780 [Myxococcales bacterium]